MRALSCVCLASVALLLTTGCQEQERPETTAYRKVVENLRVENKRLRQECDISARLLNLTTVVLVITGSALAISLFVLSRTSRRRR